MSQLKRNELEKWSCLKVAGRVTPAMAAGVTDRAWDVEDMVRLLEAEEAEQYEQWMAQRGPVLGWCVVLEWLGSRIR